jgi:hypothetical protein
MLEKMRPKDKSTGFLRWTEQPLKLGGMLSQTGPQNGTPKVRSSLLACAPHLKRWHRVTLIVVAVILSSSIAILTRPNGHPDEYLHVDAFRYFETHWWPPNLRSDEVLYSPYGVSRVYTQELVYIVYGHLGKVIQFFWNPDGAPYRIYRLINVSLFLFTLIGLFFTPSRNINPPIIGLVFVCIPQVHYIYAYANSDAFGLSMGVFLFLLVVSMTAKPVESWSWADFGLLGVFSGLILVSKKNYVLSLILPYSLVGMQSFKALTGKPVGLIRRLAVRFTALGLLVLCISAPLKVVYPMTQRPFTFAGRQMQESETSDGFKQNNPTSPSYRLGSKGEGYFDLVTKHRWVNRTLRSFYGSFGWRDGHVRSPAWMYRIACLGASLALCLTVRGATRNWGKLNDVLRACLILAPIVVILNVSASLWHSLHYDLQPQGRYIFPSLIPISLMLTGIAHDEETKPKLVRAMLFAVMYILCLCCLLYVVTNPALLV